MRAAAGVAVLVGFGCGGSEVQGGPSHDVESQRARGRELFTGRGGCLECHMHGELGEKVRGPNLGEGERKAAYVATSIIDPDAYVVPSYARGVMKPPDRPPVSLTDDDIVALAVFVSGEPDLRGARAAIEPARKARNQRQEQRRVDGMLAHVRFSDADRSRGEILYREMGCGLCHDNPRNPELQAPCLHGVGARMSHKDLARWLVAPPQTKMPSYEAVLDPSQIADLCEYMALTVPEPGAVAGGADHR
jgi:mono/diheme cytochrome c family protein